MIIFRENKETGLQCGLNDNGKLFISDNDFVYYHLKDTPENRERLMLDFDFYNDERKGK